MYNPVDVVDEVIVLKGKVEPGQERQAKKDVGVPSLEKLEDDVVFGHFVQLPEERRQPDVGQSTEDEEEGNDPVHRLPFSGRQEIQVVDYEGCEYDTASVHGPESSVLVALPVQCHVSTDLRGLRHLLIS